MSGPPGGVGVPQLGFGVAAAESFTKGLPRNNNITRANSKKVTTAIIPLGTPSDDPTDLPSPPEVCSRLNPSSATTIPLLMVTPLPLREPASLPPLRVPETPAQHVPLLQWLPLHSVPGDTSVHTGPLRSCMQTRSLPRAGDPGLWSHSLHPFRAHQDPSLPATPIRPGTKGSSCLLGQSGEQPHRPPPGHPTELKGPSTSLCRNNDAGGAD